MPLPESVTAKISRAKLHLDTFKTEVHRSTEGYSGELVVEIHPQANLRRMEFKPVAPLPTDLPLIIGDSLQNLRTAFDYLVWELVLAAKNQPTEKNAFPVSETTKLWKSSLDRGMLDGIDPAALAEIESMQPYHSGQNMGLDPLWILHKLTNINKHRRILLLRLTPEFVAPMQPGSQQYQILDPTAAHTQVDAEIVAYIAFQERGIVERSEVFSTVRQIVDFADKALVGFEKFF